MQHVNKYFGFMDHRLKYSEKFLNLEKKNIDKNEIVHISRDLNLARN